MNLVCPDCLKPVEVIVACGCKDYFCNHCNQLVSKKKVINLDNQENASLQNDSNPTEITSPQA